MVRLVVAGGDERMRLAAELLNKRGCHAWHMCTGSDEGWQEKLACTNALLLPFPYTVRDGLVPGWRHGGVEPLLQRLLPGTPVLAGRGVSETVKAMAEGRKLPLRFWEEDTAFVECNNRISAEAAVSELMQRSSMALHHQRVLLLGYGAFGREIAWRLKALGARVWVAARRPAQRRLAAGDGFSALPIEAVADLAAGMDAVLNTVPSPLLGSGQLALFPSHTVFLELASPPYGIDLPAAARLERTVAVLPGLPARYAPQSAAAAVADAALRLIKEGF